VLVVGSDPAARAGLAALLADDAGCTVIGQVAADTETPGGIDGVVPDVVVWDLGGDPATALERIAELSDGGTPVVALVDNGTTARDALAAGARGLLPRHAPAPALAASVDAASRGLVVLDPDLAPGGWRARDGLSHGDDSLGREVLIEELTPRELQVLQLLAEGRPTKSIALRLRISEHTAKDHVNTILGKLGAETRTEAVARAARLGLVLL
jgi:two-component system, NarL family, nitrate/nitrite response regulator NarL